MQALQQGSQEAKNIQIHELSGKCISKPQHYDMWQEVAQQVKVPDVNHQILL